MWCRLSTPLSGSLAWCYCVHSVILAGQIEGIGKVELVQTSLATGDSCARTLGLDLVDLPVDEVGHPGNGECDSAVLGGVDEAFGDEVGADGSERGVLFAESAGDFAR